jgi:hypothetical protein
MEDISIDIRLGKVKSYSGELSFSLHVDQKMQGQLHIYCSDPTDMRKSGVFLRLDANGYSELKKLIEKVDQTIEKMQHSQQMEGLSMQKY